MRAQDGPRAGWRAMVTGRFYIPTMRSPDPAPGDFAGNVSSSRTTNTARRRSHAREP